MDQFSNTEFKSFFSELVANPTGVNSAHAPQLRTLVELYPQSGILRALLARSIQDHDQTGFQQRLKSAAVYSPDRAVLYNLINYPEKLVKYVEPLAEEFVGDEEQVFEDDYTSYQDQEDGANGHTDETIYEEAPINYFHESEAIQQPFEEIYEPYQPIVPVEELAQPEQTTSYYNTPEAEPAPVAQYNYSAPVYEQPVIEQELAPVYQQPQIIEPAPIYQPPVVFEQPSTYYEAPAYLEPEEPEQPEPSSFGNLVYPEPVDELALPPIPGYHKLTYEEEMLDASVAASSVIDDEVYDEITGIEDIYIEPITRHRQGMPDVPLQEQQTAPVVDNLDELEDILLAQYSADDNTPAALVEPVSTYSPVQPEPVAPIEDNFYDQVEEVEEPETEEPENDEIDFEMVEPVKAPEPEPVPAVSEPYRNPRPTPQPFRKPVEQLQSQFANDDESRISKYNDEKMPYSFLWWLDKVRKEHSDTHQPYVPFKPIIQEVQRPSAGNELQQQYFENIFHLTSVEQLDMHTREKQKESEIIDRFIQQDPQLKPPNTEKLDNENKAKRSSEDKDELVSETLARIYLDQMLYTKAIATYQKLLLKFPEKSSYFVAQIKLLEKKIN